MVKTTLKKWLLFLKVLFEYIITNWEEEGLKTMVNTLAEIPDPFARLEAKRNNEEYKPERKVFSETVPASKPTKTEFNEFITKMKTPLSKYTPGAVEIKDKWVTINVNRFVTSFHIHFGFERYMTAELFEGLRIKRKSPQRKHCAKCGDETRIVKVGLCKYCLNEVLDRGLKEIYKEGLREQTQKFFVQNISDSEAVNLGIHSGWFKIQEGIRWNAREEVEEEKIERMREKQKGIIKCDELLCDKPAINSKLCEEHLEELIHNADMFKILMEILVSNYVSISAIDQFKTSDLLEGLRIFEEYWKNWKSQLDWCLPDYDTFAREQYEKYAIYDRIEAIRKFIEKKST